MPQNYGALEKVLRAGEGRRLKTLAEQAAYITSLEPEFEALSDDELRGKTAEFRQRYENGESLEDMLFEAFAAVREARKRESGQRHLRRPADGRDRPPRGRHRRDEDRRGEDVRRQPAALPERAARGRTSTSSRSTTTSRSATPSGTAASTSALGATVGYIENMMPFETRKAAYECDITYGTNSEFGFDYLRDNMAVSMEGVVQRGHTYAIVDEVDSILDRRGADAADHLRRARDGGQDLLRLRAHRQGPRGRPVQAAVEDRQARGARRRLHVRREVQDGLAAPARHPRGRARAADRQPLRPAQRPARQPPVAGAEGAGALPPRHRLRHPGRRGEDRRRVHRPDHGRPPLERGPPPGGRGQGGRATSRRSTSRWRRSRSRTTSASTRSSRA